MGTTHTKARSAARGVQHLHSARSANSAESVADDRELHRSHKDVVARLRRAEGHLRNVIAMIEGSRSCPEVAQQMHAVIRALECAKGVFIHDHIDHCLEAAVGPGREKGIIGEFKEITRYL